MQQGNITLFFFRILRTPEAGNYQGSSPRKKSGNERLILCTNVNQSINQSISDLYNGAIIRREAASRRRRDESRDQLKATEKR